MSKGKKYSYRVVEEGAGWTAQIVRKISVKESAVSKSQDGFASEKEAQAWGETQLKTFLKSLSERNKRRAEKRD